MKKKNSVAGSTKAPNRGMLRRTLFLLVVCGVAAFGVLIGKLYQLQIMEHDHYESLAVEQQIRETTITASRGTIYDANGKVLAMSASVDSVYISPKEIELNDEDPELIARELSEILDIDYETILEKTKKTNTWYQTIAKKIEQDAAEQVLAFKNKYELKGVRLETDTKRYYPYSTLAAHVIGFVGTDNNGLGGIEASYEEYLRGVNGRVVRAKNSAGTDMLFTKYEDYYDAVSGGDVYMTIDSSIQFFLEKHLANAVADYDIQNGAAAIAMEVKTGAILGMASLGGFDLNNYQMVDEFTQELIEQAQTEEEKNKLLSEAQLLQWRNKGLSDTYEPGSTFKIFTLAMALEEGLVTESDSFFCGGSIDVLGNSKSYHCWRTMGHGAQTLRQAIQHSCNVALINIGLRVGAEKFYDYARAFGFFEPTGIDLGGESDSLWWTEDVFFDKNNLSQLASASFGQTFNITPLQLITAVCAAANGGYLMEPYVVREIVGENGETTFKREPTVVRQVISEETSATIRDILESVVGDSNEGTGRNAYVPGYRIAGKTGTSEKVAKLADTGEKEYIVSFIGFAPADDPQIAILLLLDDPNPETGIYPSGGQMAAPTVGKMMADILPYLGVEPQYTEDEFEIVDKTVPRLTGLSVEEAQAKLGEIGLSARVIGTGSTVTSQLPHQNAVIAAKSEVILYADAEPSGETETVPDLTGLDAETARLRLGNAALFLRTAGGAVTNMWSCSIVSQSIPAGSEVEYGTVIEVNLVDSRDQGHY